MLNIGVFTYDFYPIKGGQGRHIYELYLQNNEFKKVNLLIFSPNENNLINHIQIFAETNKSKLKNIEFSIKVNQSLENFILKYKLDIVHFHGGPGGLFLYKDPHVPVFFTSHHTYWQQAKYIPSQKWKVLFSFFEKKGYSIANKIICVSIDTLKILEQKYGVKKNKLIYIPNGINFDKKKFKNNLKIKKKEILYLGRIEKRKGLDFLMRAIKLVNKVDPDIKLHIVGEGKDRTKLEFYARGNNLNVEFHGFLKDKQIEKLYNRVSLQVVPSIFEGFGISVLEGMNNGVPIVATNVDGIRGIIKNGFNGFLIEYNDSYKLAEKILELLSNYEMLSNIRKNASNTLGIYDWKNVYRDLVLSYEKFAAV